ncbi:MAG TPA: hypothetical protein VHJ17_05575 [Thermomonospora sp.]|nr:hypothetical protein [Thermomonospora sp.]
MPGDALAEREAFVLFEVAPHPDTRGAELRLWTRYVEQAERSGRPVRVHYRTWGPTSMTSAAMRVGGADAFGWLAGERGVHRIDRDRGRRIRPAVEVRVEVVPVAVSYDGIHVPDEDVRVWEEPQADHGGPPVSPVRSVWLRHLPTGVSAGCEGRESTRRNRTDAWTLLLSRLAHLGNRDL